jgi:uncharacterized protein (TIGR02996 family)
MDERQYFLDAIIADPDDDMPRLIYADWLEEHGDPRGEFIRIQCQRNQLTPSSPARHDLLKQEQAICKKHGRKWLAEVGVDVLGHHIFQRGFVQKFQLRASLFLKHGDGLLRMTPVECLRMPYLSGQVDRLAATDLLGRIRGLDLGSLSLSLTERDRLFREATSLRHLRMRYNGALGTDFANSLIAAPFKNQLEFLQLLNCEVRKEFYDLLAKSGGLPNLRTLQLGGVFGGPCPLLLKQVALPMLEQLDLRGDWRVVEMQELCNLGSLKRVSFRDGRIPERGLNAMIAAGVLDGVEQLSFRDVDMSEKSALALLDADLSACRFLELRGWRFQEGLWKQLASTDRLPKLEALVIHGEAAKDHQLLLGNLPVCDPED